MKELIQIYYMNQNLSVLKSKQQKNPSKVVKDITDIVVGISLYAIKFFLMAILNSFK